MGPVAAILGMLMLAALPAQAQTCPTGFTNPLAAYNGQSPSQTIINGNNVYVGNSRLQVTHTTVGSGVSIASNTISDAHITGEVGVRLGQSNADSPSRYIQSVYEFRSPASLTTYLPVAGLQFLLHDIDAGDVVIVNAYDQNGTLINLTGSGIYTLNTTQGASVVSYVNPNTFSAVGSGDVDNRQGTVNFNFGALNVSRVVLQYYDLSGGGTYTVGDFRACNPTLALYKTTQLGAGGPFNFTLTNATAATATVSTGAADTPTQVDGNISQGGLQAFSITTPNTQVTITEALPATPAGWSLVAASTTCTNAAGATIGSLNAATRVYTVPGGTTLAGQTFPGAQITCTFTNLPPRSEVQVNKTVMPSPVVSGQVATYSIVVRNNGPQAVSNVGLADVAGAGQNCSVPSTTATCTATGGATCPASLPVATLLAGGVTIPSLPVNGQVTVTLQCTVSATGFPP